MNDTQINSLLLLDALAQTIANPTASHRWHTLHALLVKETDAKLQRQVYDHVQSGIAQHGVEGFFRATFLANLSADKAYIKEAAAIAQQIEPLDAERLMAFIVYIWGTVIDGYDRNQFCKQLLDNGIPGITRLLGQHLANQTRLHTPTTQPDKAITKVALVTSYIGRTYHTPTVLVFRQADILRKMGIEVHVFSPQELRVQQMTHYFGNEVNFSTPAPDISQLPKIVPAGVSLTLSDERFSLMHRWQNLLRPLVDFEPDVVMFVGLCSPFITPLYQILPVVGLCVHSTTPIVPVDVWLTANRQEAGQPVAMWGPDLPPAWGHYHPFRVNRKVPPTLISREQLGIDEQQQIMVSTGARLPAEISGEWAERMVSLLAQHPQLVWLLIGGQATLPDALTQVAPAQIRLLRHHEEWTNVLPYCDVYVNPPRIGGGFSVAEAMAEGVPVVAFSNSDGGNKLGAHAVDDTPAYFALLEALLKDKTLREKTRASMQAIFSEALDLAQSGPSLVAACELARERFKQRQS